MRSSRREPSGLGREIERVVHLPRRMVFREVQLGEVVVVGLDVGAFRDRKAHVGEDGGELVDHLADRMHAAGLGRRLAHRQRDVDGLAVEAGIERGGAELVLARGDRGGDAILQAVDRRALTLRSSGVMAPSVFSSAETEPLLPSAATRTCSSAASSLADVTAASRSVFQLQRRRTFGADLDDQAGSAALAFSTIAWNVAGSRMARSDNTLRSTTTPAFASPSMKRL